MIAAIGRSFAKRDSEIGFAEIVQQLLEEIETALTPHLYKEGEIDDLRQIGFG
jgi:hypothetical protein